MAPMGQPGGMPDGQLKRGWQFDPTGRHEERWFDDGWGTDRVRDRSVEAIDPLTPGERMALSSVSRVREGWHLDPTGRHEQRWFSAGEATAVVRDGSAEAADPLDADEAAAAAFASWAPATPTPGVLGPAGPAARAPRRQKPDGSPMVGEDEVYDPGGDHGRCVPSSGTRWDVRLGGGYYRQTTPASLTAGYAGLVIFALLLAVLGVVTGFVPAIALSAVFVAAPVVHGVRRARSRSDAARLERRATAGDHPGARTTERPGP